MRAKRFSNDLTGTTKPRRTSRRKLEAMGIEWAQSHGRNAIPTGNLIHDRACAFAIREMTGQLPNWGEERLKELGLYINKPEKESEGILDKTLNRTNDLKLRMMKDGFTEKEVDEATQRWDTQKYAVHAPPVCTVNWGREGWIRYIAQQYKNRAKV